MSVPRFRTPEVASLNEELRGWDHPDCPFLDPLYSTGSYAPATDFTSYIAQWLAAEKIEAVQELWSYLTPDYEAPRALLRKALRVHLLASIKLADWQWQELRAIHLLVLRMSLLHGPQDGAYLAGKLAAVVIACDPLALEPDGAQRPVRAAQSEVRDDSPCDGVRGRAGAALFSVEKTQAPLGIESAAVAPLKMVSPMVRLVVHDYCTRSWGEGMLRYDLYYSERMYGCSGKWNKHFVEWLGFFEPSTDDSRVPASVTKEMLRSELAVQGVQNKKSDTRASLVEKARQVPGLLASLIQQAKPEQQQLRAEWKDAVRDWAHRVNAVEAASKGLVKLF
jgi:hypothetical protein